MTYFVETVTSLKQAQALGRITAQSFNITEQGWVEQFVETQSWQNLRVIQSQDQVMGGLKIYPMGQWFGGQRVAIAGIAGVVIAPEHRGTGVALELMQQVLHQLSVQGIALSTLYPAVQQLYRNVGYEQAGVHCQFQISPASLGAIDRRLPITPIDPADYSLLEKLYRQHAQATNGNLDRHPDIWQRVVASKTDSIYAYLIGSQDNPEGYLIFRQERKNASFNLHLQDVVMLSTAAGKRFWTFLADHRSQVDQVFWVGPSLDPLTCLLPEQPWQMTNCDRWLMRIVNVPQALATRGYPLGLTAEVSFRIKDDLLPANNGCFVLQVVNGQGSVKPGGNGDLQLQIRGLAPLYSGLLTAQQLQQIGYLTGSPETLAMATALFAGPEPWLADFF